MQLSYEKEYFVTTTNSNEIVALPYAGRSLLDRIGVVALAGGALTVDVYNRAFTSLPVNIQSITDDGNGFCQIALQSQLAVKVGDVIAVSSVVAPRFSLSISSSDSESESYDVVHRVTKIISTVGAVTVSGVTTYPTIVTDQLFETVVANSGTAALAIPSTEQALYAVVPPITGTGNAAFIATDSVPFMNLDPVPSSRNIGIPQFMYFKFAGAGDYRVAIRGRQTL